MVYRVRVINRYTNEELGNHWVGEEDLLNFIQKTSTKENKIIITF